jgi:hypothetical protein
MRFGELPALLGRATIGLWFNRDARDVLNPPAGDQGEPPGIRYRCRLIRSAALLRHHDIVRHRNVELDTIADGKKVAPRGILTSA